MTRSAAPPPLPPLRPAARRRCCSQGLDLLAEPLQLGRVALADLVVVGSGAIVAALEWWARRPSGTAFPYLGRRGPHPPGVVATRRRRRGLRRPWPRGRRRPRRPPPLDPERRVPPGRREPPHAGEERGRGAEADAVAGAELLGDPADDRPADRRAAEEQHRLEGEHPAAHLGRRPELHDRRRRHDEADRRQAEHDAEHEGDAPRWARTPSPPWPRRSRPRPRPTWRTPISRRRAATRAPMSEPTLTTENSAVNAASLLPRSRVTNSGNTVWKL